MIKVDNGTADTGQKMYKFNNKDIDLIHRILIQEKELVENVISRNPLTISGNPFWKKRLKHINSMINELEK